MTAHASPSEPIDLATARPYRMGREIRGGGATVESPTDPVAAQLALWLADVAAEAAHRPDPTLPDPPESSE